jgi:hypothetical protein
MSVVTLEANSKTVTIVREDGVSIGCTVRREYEVPARGVFYPCTTTRKDWSAGRNGETVGVFNTRKAAIEALQARVKAWV